MSERTKHTPAGGAAVRSARDEADLFAAFAALRDADEAGRFLRDIATPGEVAALAERWRIARLLDERALSYREIAAATGASTTTIARVARFLKEEPHRGYRLMIDRMRKSERRKASRS
ncbi:MAG: hypothetical protein Kow00133_08220 [Amphiplicatus sp.]